MHRMILSILAFVFIYASDARFAGMGNLAFILEDDLHKLNLYDFAGISAGLLKTDSFPSAMLRASLLKEIWQKDSLTYFALGQAIPQKLADFAPVEAISFYEVIPQFPGVPCEVIYTSPQLKETYDDWGNLKAPQSWRIYAGYSQLTRGYIGDTLSDKVKTPAFSAVFSRPISKAFDYGITGDLFYGMYNSADKKDKATLLPPGCGIGFVYNGNKMSLGFNTEYHYPMFEFRETYGDITHTTEFNGHSASPTLGSLVKLDKITWITALDYKWLSLGGKYDTFSLGDLKMTGYNARTMALFVPGFTKFAFLGEYSNRTPVLVDKNGNKDFEVAYRNYTLGIGSGMMREKLVVALEGLYKYSLSTDKIRDTTIVGADFTIKLGLESRFSKNLFIRAGYNYNQQDPNLDKADDHTIFNVITGGLGINLIKNARLDIAYNYKLGKVKFDPEERITDHIGYLYLRYNLPERD